MNVLKRDILYPCAWNAAYDTRVPRIGIKYIKVCDFLDYIDYKNTETIEDFTEKIKLLKIELELFINHLENKNNGTKN